MGLESGELRNEAQGGYNPPFELSTYKHQVKFTPPNNFESYIKWELLGDIPLHLTINEQTGLITGNIELLSKQPSAKNAIYEYQLMKIDGSNWRHLGILKNGQTFTFNFQVKLTYTVQANSGGSRLSNTVTEVSDVTITILQDNDIISTLFCKNYIDEAKFPLKIGDKVYTDAVEFMKNHPNKNNFKINLV
ncbi:hypothetical protein NCTC12673_gp035 [Campylobacter phage NCTC12673]|uniref:Uncharacterized protein n=3 Tax=Fletchervirus TaxID=1636618 RepID=J9SI13_9CAUD|nr:hypothetical protein NCTC12673_gp035 [Campylobacter phage NCTC12673]YP_006908101.1 hypothetical protein D302_gp039 [Campylobacter phage CP30A]YP_009321691.1 hypothetical protein BOX06_gp092 [Campylobacter phage PC14]AEA86382.1 hypothetical protein [Campylobacter phage NCTC12673]AFR52351.1 hypothetical protein [Campylobacter phage CP30A]ANH51385.1 hypothetical protein PC14_00092 [Campylobacter phage PC14]